VGQSRDVLALLPALTLHAAPAAWYRWESQLDTPGLRPNIARACLDPGRRALPRRRLPSATLTALAHCPLRRLAKDTA
jgi:hypothetical protein